MINPPVVLMLQYEKPWGCCATTTSRWTWWLIAWEMDPMNASMNKNEFAFKLPEMLSYHSTWEDADYEPTLPRRHQSWVVRMGVATVRWFKDYAERRRVVSELSQMSDRELADLGLSRYDIPRVFDPEFAAEHAARL
jgi:uncharacterized protein YjiS (DUF1127 family)